MNRPEENRLDANRRKASVAFRAAQTRSSSVNRKPLLVAFCVLLGILLALLVALSVDASRAHSKILELRAALNNYRGNEDALLLRLRAAENNLKALLNNHSPPCKTCGEAQPPGKTRPNEL